jgi:hypothetical protein
VKIIFSILLTSFLLLIGCSKTDEKQNGFSDLLEKIPLIGNSKTQSLEKIMNVDTLGIQREYFEKNYGPAKRSIGNSWQYEIEKCSIGIEYDSKNAINSVELQNISKKCTFNGKNINLTSMADKINYRELIEVAMDWHAKLSCYTMCGNAADPDYGAYVETPRVFGFLEFEATTNYPESEKASEEVKNYFKKKYPNIDLFGDDLGEIPKEEYNKIWLEKFKDVKLSMIKFGYNLHK